MIACSKCDEYNRHGPGSGSRACLKCRRYRDMQRASVKRHTIRIEPVPQIVLEAIPEIDHTEGATDMADAILQHLHALPIRTAIILHASHKLGATDKEIAEQLNISSQHVGRLRAAGYVQLQEIFSPAKSNR